MTARCLAAAMLALAPLGWQAAPQPARGAISGVVLSTDEQPRPVRRATVTLSGGVIPSNLSVLTDDAGRFQFVDLPAGRYSVSVTKAAYLSMMYGATRAGRPGTPIELGSDQRLDVRVRLPKGAVITGHIRNEQANPISNAEVGIALAETASGARGLALSPTTVLTNDEGEYRMFGLAPGEYLVYVSASSGVSGNGVIRMTTADFDARVRALEQRLAIPGSANPTPPPAAPTLGFAPTFYPGTPSVSDAGRVRVAAGEERAGVDIAFVPVPATHVSGVIQGGNTPLARLMPTLTPIGPSMPSGLRPIPNGPHDDGSFVYSNVTPGRYVLMVRSGQGALTRSANGNSAGGDTSGSPAMFAMQEVTVTGGDIGGLVLSLRPAVSITGTVALDVASGKAPETLAGISVLLAAIGPSLTTTSGISIGIGLDRPPESRTSATGAFELVGALPGTYTLRATPPAGLWLRSAMVNGQDLLDDHIAIDGNSSDIAGVVVTFSDRVSGIQGTLTTAPGQPAPEFTVIAFPVDGRYWKAGARRVKTTRPSNDGSFALSQLPAGAYYLAALTDVEPAEAQQPAFLEQLVGSAVKVTVAEGQQARQDLRIVR